MKLTDTQQAILGLIAERIEAEGVPPSQAEIARAFSFDASEMNAARDARCGEWGDYRFRQGPRVTVFVREAIHLNPRHSCALVALQVLGPGI